MAGLRQRSDIRGMRRERYTYTYSCAGKARHKSQNAARAAIRYDRIAFGEENMWGMKPYRCSHCGWWHLGHSLR